MVLYQDFQAIIGYTIRVFYTVVVYHRTQRFWIFKKIGTCIKIPDLQGPYFLHRCNSGFAYFKNISSSETMQAPGIKIDDLLVGLRDIEQMTLMKTPVGKNEDPFKSHILSVRLDDTQFYNFTYSYYDGPDYDTIHTKTVKTSYDELALTITETMQSNRNPVQVEGNINDTSRVFNTHLISIFPLFLFQNRNIANKLYTEYVDNPEQFIGKMTNLKYGELKSAEEKLEYICYAATYWVIMVPDNMGQVKLHTPEGTDQTAKQVFRKKIDGYKFKFVKINNPLKQIKGGSVPVSAYILAGLSVVLGCAMLPSFVKP